MMIGILVLAAFQIMAQEPAGSIEGTVVDGVSHAPVKKAQVIASPTSFIPQPTRPGEPSQSPKPRQTTTDASGAFSFRGLAPGQYTIQVSQPHYPQLTLGSYTNVEVKTNGEPVRVSFDLQPGASVSGHVLDQDGDPIGGCVVQLRTPRTHHQAPGVLGMKESDESGEYRVWGIPAGKYMALVLCPRPVFEPRPLSPGPPAPPTRAYAPQYYPLARDPKSADVIELSPGSIKSGIDFHPVISPVYSVTGTVSFPADRTSSARIFLIPAGPSAVGHVGLRAGHLDPAKHTFTIDSVLPGPYTLVAFTEGDPDNMAARRRVEILDRSVQVRVELRPAIDLSGTVELESGREIPRLTMIQLTPTETPVGADPGAAKVDDNGRFTLKSVPLGIWRVGLSGPGNAFLKSVTVAGREQSGEVIDISGGSAGPVTIVASTNTATVRGTAAPRQYVRVVEQGEDIIGWRDYSTVAGDSGEFQITGLKPGQYRIVAADRPGPLRDEDGQDLTVHEGETITLDLKQGSR